MPPAAALALTLLIHEAGHALSARACGAPVFGMRVRPGGLSMLCRTSALPYSRAAFVYAGGALANLLTAAVFFRVRPLASYSVGAAVFNLLPLPGSDGAGIVSALVALAVDDGARADKIVGAVSDACLILFWLLAVYLAVTGQGGGAALVFAVLLLMERFSGN